MKVDVHISWRWAANPVEMPMETPMAAKAAAEARRAREAALPLAEALSLERAMRFFGIARQVVADTFTVISR